MQRTELMTWLQQELAVDMFKDYAPNALQLQAIGCVVFEHVHSQFLL